MSDYVDRIAKLDKLRQDGAITQEEFDRQKKTILQHGEGGDGNGAKSKKDKTTTLILAILGLHYFYLGRIGMGILYLFTFAGLGIWWIIDIINAANGNLVDDKGARVY